MATESFSRHFRRRRHSQASLRDPRPRRGSRSAGGRRGISIKIVSARSFAKREISITVDMTTESQEPYPVSTSGASSATLVSFTFALVTRITDSTTITLPITMKRSTRSCRTSQPRNTATTGFTYAYVDTFDVGTCSSSQMYAVYPIHEPHTTRYVTAPTPRAVHATREKSPTASANAKFATPAAVTCHAVLLNTSTPDCQRFASTDPSAQENDPPSKLSEAENSRRPRAEVECNSGQNSTKSPTIPRPSPALPRHEIR